MVSLALFLFALVDQGGTRDFIVVGSDSGRIAILEFDANRNCFEKVHLETYGKTGCRRIVPGQYLAMDPRGRAVMIGNDFPLFFSPVEFHFHFSPLPPVSFYSCICV